MVPTISRRQVLTGSGIALAGCLPVFQADAWSKDPTKNAFSLHIGVNQHQENSYPEGIARLAGCAIDANFCLGIAKKKGVQKSVVLIDEKATIKEVRRYIYHAATYLSEGDIFFVSYAGHGTQVKDSAVDKVDDAATNNAWCLYDGLMLDKYLYFLWSQFKPGVRILVVADTSYTRSATRVRESARGLGFDLANASSHTVAGGFASRAEAAGNLPKVGLLAERGDVGIYGKSEPIGIRPRTISARQADAAFQFPGNKAEYERQSSESRESRLLKSIAASGILLTGCQDTEISYETSSKGFGGFFTKGLNNAFESMPPAVKPSNIYFNSYSSLIRFISVTMPTYQRPSYVPFGKDNEDFSLKQAPFTV